MRGKDVILKGVSVRFADFTAVHKSDLKIEAGEFFSILGPSGCGKTTLLRMMSGFLQLIGGESMTGIGPSDRPTALIFQNLALFPLMTVWENVAFGLEMRGWSKAKRRNRALELLATVALSDQAEKTPAELSGGQRQRVAIARALAVEPAVLLLDEPLSALDLKLRQHMRAELKEIQKATGITFIYITHDQGEALTMSDRVAVMRNGRIEQVDTPDNIYSTPANSFVATFVGENNLLRGDITEIKGEDAILSSKRGSFRARNAHGLAVGSKAILFVRPERIEIVEDGSGVENSLEVAFVRRDLEGPFVNLLVSNGDTELTVHQTNYCKQNQTPRDKLTIAFPPAAATIMAEGILSDE